MERCAKMCGIAGYKFIEKDENLFQNNINQILNSLKNRGPDFQDYWHNQKKNCFLLNTRLKIQDLNNRANMPMLSVCKKFVITYNGELYNKKFLIEKYLKNVRLETNSDTEVILQLYIIYDNQFLSFLDGMYSIAIYDSNKDLLFLARDPLGIKPLYYTLGKNYLYFSSSVKSFYFKKKLNREALIDYFSLGFIREPKTILENVESLEPGHFLIYKNNKLVKKKYFELKNIFTNQNKVIDIEIEKSVMKHYTNEVSSCLFLSSGIDSNLILAILKKNNIEIPTISISFENFRGDTKISNESRIIENICNEHKVENHHSLITKDLIKEYDNQFCKEMDQPTTDGLNSFIVSKIANQMNHKVAYSGLGGDELFCDYGTLKKIKFIYNINKMVKFFGIREILSKFLKKINLSNPKYKNIFDYDEVSQIYYFIRSLFISGEKVDFFNNSILLDKFEEKKLPFNNLYLNTSYLEYKIYLRNQLLRDSDWTSMANSIELRVPFVNKDLILNTFQVNPKITRKNILKKINKNIFSQISKKKIGFYTPTYNVTNYHNPLKDRSFSVLKNYIEINNLKI
jgi:asparagine synthase (glutamine-hydrolysing)